MDCFILFKFCGVKQNLIQKRGGRYLPMFYLGWIIDPYIYIYSFFYGSHEVLVLHPHYAEIFLCTGMTCGVVMVIYLARDF